MKLLFDALKVFQQDDTIIPGLVYFILQFTIQCHNQQRTTPDLLSNSSRYEEITQAFTNLLTHHFLNYRHFAHGLAILNKLT